MWAGTDRYVTSEVYGRLTGGPEARPVDNRPGWVYCPRMPRSTLVVREDEKPWTIAEEREVRAALEEDLVRLRAELDLSARDLQDLLRDGVDSAGNDQADIGSQVDEGESEGGDEGEQE